MADPYLGEIRIFSFNFAPKGWAMCNGQLLAINQFQALFALLGTTYGGNGTQNFALPNLQGQVPVHFGSGFTQGQTGGEASHTLITSEMPAHTHIVSGNSTANTASPAGDTWATAPANAYATTASGAMLPSAIGQAGGSQPHENRQPYLVLNVCIAMVGIFPSRN
jgi:microcystin-dependent protein